MVRPLIPVVRYLLVCDDCREDARVGRIDIVGLVSNVRPRLGHRFPVLMPSLCVVVLLTDQRVEGRGRIDCVAEETGVEILDSGYHSIGADGGPLAVRGVVFRFVDSLWPGHGWYRARFWYEGQLLGEQPVRAVQEE